MSLWQRLKNLWELSEEPAGFEFTGTATPTNDPPGTVYRNLTDLTAKATVIPYKKRDPVKEIIGEETETV